LSRILTRLTHLSSILMMRFMYELSHDPLMPPPEMVENVGGGGEFTFKRVGESLLQQWKNYASLGPHERVLDVGCGCGRMAIPLARYFSRDASYEGFDITKSAVDWCVDKITYRFPNFHFRFADIFNGVYNPRGKIRASEYRFPYEDQSFDFVFLTSVFTHMLPEDVSHYLSEICRVLRKHGRCWITFFLLNEESRRLIESNKSRFNFAWRKSTFAIENESAIEAVVAYDEDFARNLFRRNGLEIREPIRYGSWCGRTDVTELQDSVIAYRTK